MVLRSLFLEKFMFDKLRVYAVKHSNFVRARMGKIRYVVIHCSTGTPEKQMETLERLGLSVHFIIGADGKLFEVAPLEKVAYHAGMSSWFDSPGQSLNEESVGIEIESADLGQTSESFSKASMTRLYKVLEYLTYQYKIRPENIVGHSDIAPTRKPDPGAGFNWKKLYRHGYGVWYKSVVLSPERDEKKLLAMVGYNVDDLVAARCAFCRRFLPEEVAVVSDISALVNQPYPKDFDVFDKERYFLRLRAVARAFDEVRQKKYWDAIE